jgi:maltooligosyltrehalose trehalohydrolase
MTRLGRAGVRRLGAHAEAGGVRFAVFTEHESCSVRLVSPTGDVLREVALEPLGEGYFETTLPDVKHGDLYWFVVAGRALPDPFARYLPQGVHGPAMVIVPRYASQHLPPARPLAKLVLYELHVGTFTPAGTFAAASTRLRALAELGVTTVQLMPVAAFAGEHGWGYDGVALFATHAAYGTPDELRELIDVAHGLGLSVLLDVVYNHFGPAGNYLATYAKRYFTDSFQNAWGAAPNFAEPALRELVLDSARYWLREVGFDGLRLDATHAIFDPSSRHILSELAEVAHELEPKQLLIAEDERNQAELLTHLGLDAVWADDFHHQLHVSLTGERHGYYGDFEAGAQGLADVINRGWLYCGQRSPRTGEARGSSANELPAEAFVYCIQNHDQVGNRALGERLGALTSIEAYRAASLLLLFLPMTPLLFMGQEWGASSPFLYFTDHEPELGRAVSAGRRREFAAFPAFARADARESIPDPQAKSTFSISKLVWQESELEPHQSTLELYRQALALRRDDEVLARAGREQLLADASQNVLRVHRWFGNRRRALLMNLGPQPVELGPLIDGLRLQNPRKLLGSSDLRERQLPRHAALVLGGEGNLAGLAEGGV